VWVGELTAPRHGRSQVNYSSRLSPGGKGEGWRYTGVAPTAPPAEAGC
jgi:hypothetical protein